MLIVGIFYFALKEITRIRSNNELKNGEILIIGSIIGILVFISFLYVSLGYQFQESIPTKISQTLGPEAIWFTPSIIIMIIFVVMFDRKLIFPIMFFQLIAYFISVNWNEVYNNTPLWSEIMLDIIVYFILLVVIYFTRRENENLFKNNGIKVTFAIALYFILIIIKELFHSLTVYQTEANLLMILEIIFIELTYLSLYFAFQFLIILFVEKIYLNFSSLETFSTKDDISYYKMSLAQNKLRFFLSENKINMGILVLFDVKTNEKNQIHFILNQIRKKTNKKFNHSFFFKVTANYYGAFYSISEDELDLDLVLKNNKKKSRTDKDVFYKITSEIDKIVKDFEINIISSASIYGLHSYSISDLIEYCKFLFTSIVVKSNLNSLVVYDFKRVKKRLTERANVLSLPINVENVKINFLRGISENQIYYPQINFKKENGERIGLEDLISDSNISSFDKNSILRYFSYQTLRSFNNESASLIIFYSPEYLASSEFDYIDFFKKTKRHILANKLVVGLFVDESFETKLFKQNIELLRKMGVRFALIHTKNTSQSKHNILNPDFILKIDKEMNPFKMEKVKLNLKTNAIILNPNLV